MVYLRKQTKNVWNWVRWGFMREGSWIRSSISVRINSNVSRNAFIPFLRDVSFQFCYPFVQRFPFLNTFFSSIGTSLVSVSFCFHDSRQNSEFYSFCSELHLSKKMFPCHFFVSSMKGVCFSRNCGAASVGEYNKKRYLMARRPSSLGMTV